LRFTAFNDLSAPPILDPLSVASAKRIVAQEAELMSGFRRPSANVALAKRFLGPKINVAEMGSFG
jgi:hypothetical protein